MKMKKILLLILLICGLQACASPKMSEELEAGKMKFKAGNYKESFHDLLPIAAYGNKEAQYAVGYMYFYGMGAPADGESGEFWMKKSAAQYYAPAINALKIIQGMPSNSVPANTY